MMYLAYVPYDKGQWVQFWDAIMTTIGSASYVGLIIFGVLACIGIFRVVIHSWIHS